MTSIAKYLLTALVAVLIATEAAALPVKSWLWNKQKDYDTGLYDTHTFEGDIVISKEMFERYYGNPHLGNVSFFALVMSIN